MTDLTNIHYQNKYIKYKTKYAELKQLGGKKNTYATNSIYCFFTTQQLADQIQMDFNTAATTPTPKLSNNLFNSVISKLNKNAFYIEDGGTFLVFIDNTNKRAPNYTLKLALNNKIFNRSQDIITVLTKLIEFGNSLSVKPEALVVIKNSKPAQLIEIVSLKSKAKVILKANENRKIEVDRELARLEKDESEERENERKKSVKDIS